LEKRFGKEFENYKKRVRRYFWFFLSYKRQ
jgi:protein-S-isoprenylcysteine O-methyltransferase Ste14